MRIDWTGSWGRIATLGLACAFAACSPAPETTPPPTAVEPEPPPTTEPADPNTSETPNAEPETSETPNAEPETSVGSPFAGFWLLRMERSIWWPTRVPGSLAVHETEGGLRASVTFDPMWGLQPMPLELATQDDGSVTGMVKIGGEHDTPLKWEVDGDDLWGTVRWDSESGVDESVVRARCVTVERFERDSPTDPFPIETDPAAVGVDPAALDRLIHYASLRDTDALIVVKDGRLLCDRTFLRGRVPIDVQNITQVVAALAPALTAGDDTAAERLDEPLASTLPELAGDHRRGALTLRHILSYTTGLASSDRDVWDGSIGRAEHMLTQEFDADPGTVVDYNSDAFELLPILVSRRGDLGLDALLQERVFGPLGIDSVTWQRDGRGRPCASDGLRMLPLDLARLGHLIASSGLWNGDRVVPADWIGETLGVGSYHDEMGLGWTLRRFPDTEMVEQTAESIDRLEAIGYPHARKLEPMIGRRFESRREWAMAALEIMGEDALSELGSWLGRDAVGATVSGPIAMAVGRGTDGQYLFVFPDLDLVVLRLRRGFPSGEGEDHEMAAAWWVGIDKLVMDLPLR